MSFLRTYYQVKPFLPHGMRLAFRRWRAERRKRAFAAEWPIKPAAAAQPAGWTGWPDGKKFALVLTHDVERMHGLEQSRAIADVEMERGFRSAFNFVPEGDYHVPAQFRHFLSENGFEVGVHDLKHDGKLYWSRVAFLRNARAINRYLRDWNAVGFRSGFMHHNLDWLHELDVLYDSSTFDTDPFEPQPDGVDTIFPFWVPAPGAKPPIARSDFGTTNHEPRITNNGRTGYVELPYTLAQDFTLFLLLQEKTIEIWKRKLDWIVEHGGMAMLDVHPDYVDVTGPGQPGASYPLKFYVEFLDYVQQRYEGQFWQPLPKQVAQFAKDRVAPADNGAVHVLSAATPKRRKIWIDLDNTPHVLFFEPIIEELSARGFEVVLTARDAFQVCELADQKGLRYTKIGRHHGKNKFLKLLGLFYRALQLAPFVRREKPDLAVSHGARSQMVIANLFRIPTVLIDDYEFSQYPFLMGPRWEIVPEVIPDSSVGCAQDRIRKYPGTKEDVYVGRMKPDPDFLKNLGISPDELLITVRPPATEAHYHNPEAEKLFAQVMDIACRQKNSRIVLLPRHARQGEAIRAQWPRWFENSRTLIPRAAVDGLNLLWHSDFIVGGGGTMNREAAALGVPVYSVFRGKIGAVDAYLQKIGRLVLLESPQDVDEKINWSRRDRHARTNKPFHPALAVLVGHIETIARLHFI